MSQSLRLCSDSQNNYALVLSMVSFLYTKWLTSISHHNSLFKPWSLYPLKKKNHPARCYSFFLGIVMNLYNSLLSYILHHFTDSSRSYAKIGLKMTLCQLISTRCWSSSCSFQRSLAPPHKTPVTWWPMKKKRGPLLSIESWLFSRDPEIMIY